MVYIVQFGQKIKSLIGNELVIFYTGFSWNKNRKENMIIAETRYIIIYTHKIRMLLRMLPKLESLEITETFLTYEKALWAQRSDINDGKTNSHSAIIKLYRWVDRYHTRTVVSLSDKDPDC
jgi:hypothetical protein